MIDELAFRYNRDLKNRFLRKYIHRFYYLFLGFSKWIRSGRTDGFTQVTIETTSQCNRRCSYCPVSVKPRKKALLKSEVFRKVIDELAKMEYSGSLWFSHFSEPLMDKRLADFVRYARSRLPKAYIVITSNGDMLTEQLFYELERAGISKIYVTFHNEKKMQGKYGLVRSLRKKSKKILFRNLSSNSLLMSRGGLVKVKNKETMDFCGFPSNTLVIDVTGNVVLCCEDYLGKYSFGNVEKESIAEIWQKPKFRKIRKDTMAGRFSLDICRHCTSE
ncbi:SPASM domain-containing protein [Candidatus Woesearchaeota archaeon]|nr:SPASM domain-containing protein [Candidatus Woesearchaeota archaeon]